MPKTSYKKHIYNLGDGAIVEYIPGYAANSDQLFDELLNSVPWRKFTYEVNGQLVQSPRFMHIYNFDNKFPYLEKFRNRIQRLTKKEFKYVVLNYYRDGNDYIGYHPDREVESGDIVVSVSLGATRRFALKHKFRENVRHVFMLADGDLMILNEPAIKGAYKHSIPKMRNVGPRINMTFREK